MAFRPALRRRALSVIATVALAGGTFATSAVAAHADTSPVSSATPTTVGTAPLPTAQLAGPKAIGWGEVAVGSTVYVVGSFSAALPPGSTSGSVARGNVMAYNVTTGALTSFAPATNGEVRTIAASPDGTVLYLGGDFTAVNGTARNRIAAVSASTGALLPWSPNANSTVRVIRATASTVYFGGAFSSVSNVPRSHAAAASATTGALTSWAPSANNAVQSMAISPDGTRVALGGFFNSLNGVTGSGFGIVDGTSGSTNFSTPVTKIVNDGSTTSAIWGMSSDSTNVYASGYYAQQARDGSGNLEGTFAVNWSTGATTWLEDCHGDEYQSAVLNGALYVVGHPHYCGDVDGGYPQISIKASQRAVAFTTAATTPLKTNTLLQPRYYDFAGQPGPSLLDWFPVLATGTASGSSQAAWYVTAAGNYIVMTGEFPTVNGAAQYGNVRFALPSVAKDTDGPQLSGTAFPVTVTSVKGGTVHVAWTANNDHDSENLTYTLYRGSTAVYSTSAASRLWYERPTMSYTDTAVTPGSTYSYRVVAIDSSGNSATGATTSFTVPAASASAYAQQIVADGATSYWRLGEGSGSAVADTAGGFPATTHGNVRLGAAGAIAGDSNTAATFDGSSATGIATNAYQYPTDTVSVEAWFRSTSSVGGEILGGGDQQGLVSQTFTDPTTGKPVTVTNDSQVHDRELATTGDGHVTFTIDPGAVDVVTSAKGGYNDGRWHHLVGSLSAAGQVLYIDGAQVAANTSVKRAVANAEYWRIGGDSGYPGPRDPNAPPGPPPSTPNYFSGSIDEPAVYVGKVLTAAQVSNHYALGIGTGGGAVNAPPTASFTSSSSGLTASVDGSASSDSDGTVKTFAWSFGDNGSATGPTASHTYAASGTYTVTLTVTDDSGASSTVQHTVTVSGARSTIASDSFARTLATGLGNADTGGAYTLAGSSSKYSVGGGAASLAVTKGSTLTALLGSTSSSDTDLSASIGLSAVPNGGSAFAYLIGRSANGSDYRARVQVAAGGKVSLAVMRGATVLATTSTALTYAAGDRLDAEVQVYGVGSTTVRARVWEAGAARPATWQVTGADGTTALQGAGSVGFASYVGTGSTISPLTVTFDDLLAVPTGN